MTTTSSIDSPEFRKLLIGLDIPEYVKRTLITFIDAKIAEAVKAERDEWIAQLKLLEKAVKKAPPVEFCISSGGGDNAGNTWWECGTHKTKGGTHTGILTCPMCWPVEKDTP